MADRVTILKVLVASPSDCATARKRVASLLANWSRTNGSRFGVRLEPDMWEDAAPELGVDSPQRSIDRQIVDRADAIIALFWTRIGTPTDGHESGTAAEIARFLRDNRPGLVYFSKELIPPDVLDPDQYRALLSYRAKLEQFALIGDYAAIEELEDKLTAHLPDLVTRILAVRAPNSGAEISRERESEARASRKPGKAQRYAADTQKVHDYEELYEPVTAVRFYNEIAAYYDARNSSDLVKTHYGVIREMKSCIGARPDARILDLGGGTGYEIASHFAPDDVSWTYVDAADEMARTFRRNFRRASMRTSVILGNASYEIENFAHDGRQFDIIVVSWLLSSMPVDLDFAPLAKIVAPRGILIVADADPQNLAAKPIFGFSIGERQIGLRLRQVDPRKIITSAEVAGLRLTKQPSIVGREAGGPYAFIHVYGPLRGAG
jgi:2-polyprenyl-3-methyl-5-hydroxy-6-metoxy-1,4-benzoquinol methylase